MLLLKLLNSNLQSYCDSRPNRFKKDLINFQAYNIEDPSPWQQLSMTYEVDLENDDQTLPQNVSLSKAFTDELFKESKIDSDNGYVKSQFPNDDFTDGIRFFSKSFDEICSSPKYSKVYPDIDQCKNKLEIKDEEIFKELDKDEIDEQVDQNSDKSIFFKMII